MNALNTISLYVIAYKRHSVSLKNITISYSSIVSLVLVMPFSISIVGNMLYIRLVIQAAYEAVPPTIEAIFIYER
jgi:hypothetical protein